MKILVLNKSKEDRSAIKTMLTSQNTDDTVFESISVDDAINQVSRETFDVVIADHTPLNTDDFQLLKALKHATILSNTTIVITSNNGDDPIALDYIRAGAHDFLAKQDVSLCRIQRAHITAQHIFMLEENLQKSNETIKQLSYSDGVTGLANQVLFREQLQGCIHRHAGAPTHIALLNLRINRLRYLDQNQGTSVNEFLLKKIVNRIRGCLRGDELFARLDGDVFAIMCPNIHDYTEAGKLAQRIIRVMDRPIMVNNVLHNNQASVGIAVFPDNAINIEDLEKFAKIALEKARSEPVDRLAYYRSEMKAEYSKHFAIETGLREALSKRQFTLHYQPAFDPTTHRVLGFEALIRWITPEKNYSPYDFIPIAEESSLIMEIGRWVIQEAIHQLAQWNATSDTLFTMSINLSPKQLHDPQLIPFIETTLAHSNVAPNLIEFELTETALLENSHQNVTTINRISDMGCTIALDDFGTGFSSFSHLKSFPINSVKIDRSLMPSSPDNKAENSLIRGLVSMVNSLELRVIGEGAETAEHAKLCAELKMNAVQGYYFSKPLEKELIENQFVPQESQLTENTPGGA